jgi:hypothetical protein
LKINDKKKDLANLGKVFPLIFFDAYFLRFP